MAPSSSGEIMFAMIMMIANLTLFSYVLGQISAAVMESARKQRPQLHPAAARRRTHATPSANKMQ